MHKVAPFRNNFSLAGGTALSFVEISSDVSSVLPRLRRIGGHLSVLVHLQLDGPLMFAVALWYIVVRSAEDFSFDTHIQVNLIFPFDLAACL